MRNPRLYDRVTVVVDTPTVLIPEDEYTSGSATRRYRIAFSMLPADEVQTSPLDTLGVVLAFAVNKDLHFVLNENFRYVCFAPRLASTLTALSQRAHFGGHDGKPSASIPRSGGFNRGIQGENIGLERNAGDDRDNFHHSAG